MVAVEQPEQYRREWPPIDRVLEAETTGCRRHLGVLPAGGRGYPKPYDVVVTGSSSTGILFAPSIVTGVGIGDTMGTMNLYASPSATTAALSTATITGQVTSVNTSLAGVVVDAYLSVLKRSTACDYTIPLPSTATQIGGANVLVTTASAPQSPPCNPLSADCINYSLQTPGGAALHRCLVRRRSRPGSDQIRWPRLHGGWNRNRHRLDDHPGLQPERDAIIVGYHACTGRPMAGTAQSCLHWLQLSTGSNTTKGRNSWQEFRPFAVM